MVGVREWSRRDTVSYLRVPGVGDDKYSRGVVALRTGSSAYPGAAVLGVEAAWRAGSGFVRYVGGERAADAVLARRPETVTGTDVGRTRPDAWVIGSGTDPADRTDDERAALQHVLSGSARVVVDAGALDLAPGSSAPLIVTPHAGEFARLRDDLGLRPADPDDRIADTADTADALGHAVLLKGARTIIAAPTGPLLSVRSAPGWLATAGAGDVLAGVVGALLAAHPSAPIVEVAASAAWLHGYAARVAAGMDSGGIGRPIVAMDVAEALPRAIEDLLS